MLALPVFGRILASELQQGVAVELILCREVSVKPAACQPCLGHDLFDRYFRESLSVEQSSCAAEDSLAGFLLALKRIGHRRFSHWRPQHYAPAKDVLEHLLPLATLRAHFEKSTTADRRAFDGVEAQREAVMSSWLLTPIVVAGACFALWLVSYIVESVRPSPDTPAALRWAPEIPIDYVDVGGAKLRFVKVGAGPTIVLLHTLRTQLDLFERMIPDLSKRFTVYALDYPGHGYSDIPKARYDAALFAAAIEGFLNTLDLRDVTLAGVSIGAVIPLIVAARRNPRVARVVSINPYDYAKGRGMARSSLFGWMATYVSLIPVIGETVMRVRSFIIMSHILQGGVVDPNSISPALMAEMYRVGDRPWHYRAFISLLRSAKSWELAQQDYGRINVPVLLIFGDKDWSRPSERERTRSLIPNVVMKTVEGGGHFLPLDRPRVLSELLIGFAGA
jgi:pimeloyl-ACP methyl ester carboxylesterase